MSPRTLEPDRDLTIDTEVDPHDPAALVRALVPRSDGTPLVLVVDRTGRVRGEAVVAGHPVDAMYGRRAPSQAAMVGLRAPASVTRRDEGPSWAGGVVHLVSRDGVSATAVRAEDGVTTVFGPDVDPQHGRVPDACRRLLDLATPPPQVTMTAFVFSSWLAVIHGRLDDVFDWRTIVRLHPAAAALGDLPSAAGVAAATRELGESMDWERFRRVIAAVGGFPFGTDARTIAAWADAGMFSRWAMDELPPLPDALGRLVDEVSPDAIDRLWAAAHLCGAIDDTTDA